MFKLIVLIALVAGAFSYGVLSKNAEGKIVFDSAKAQVVAGQAVTAFQANVVVK